MATTKKPDDFRDKLLLEIHKEVGTLGQVYGRMEVDVRTHIKRTDLLEIRVDLFQKYIYMAHGAAGLLVFLAALLKYWPVISKLL